jgi:predicted ATPase
LWKEMTVSELAAGFDSLPPAYQGVLSLAQAQHNIGITPLQELKGGRTAARLYLVSVSRPEADPVEHLVLKLDRVNPKARSDEVARHDLALSQAPSDFSRQHMAQLAFERVEQDGAVAIFYSVAGQSLHHFRPLSSFERQSQLEVIFRATHHTLLSEWNAHPLFEQAVHPTALLSRWLTYRLKPGGKIDRFLQEEHAIHPDTGGFLVQGQVFPNPLAYARAAERWGPARPIDVISGFLHRDLNIGNILVKFARDGESLEGYYLIDFALFMADMPLLYDQPYLELSYLLRELTRVPFAVWVELVTRFATEDIPDPRQVPVALAGACAAIGAGRSAFDQWVQTSHPSLTDDLWGQYRLAAAAAGLNYCNKDALSEQERLAGLIFAAAHMKRYAASFGVPLPVEVAHLYDADSAMLVHTAARAARPGLPNLPAQPTPLVGREREVVQIRDTLLRDEVRLLTLTGPGGTGKTRLGVQAGAELADHFKDGVFFVSLAEIAGSQRVVSEVARQLGVREGGSQPLLDNLKGYLRGKSLLLLLDNFEHVLAAAPQVAELLAAAPRLKALVTSRAPLNLRGEHEFPVPPLQLPDDGQSSSLDCLGEYEAVRLFVQRAQAAQPEFTLTAANAPAVVEICRRLDGLPLAIELAAARIKLLSPQALLARLKGDGMSRLQVLSAGARDLPARQQTLRNTLDWSYGLLGESEQRLFSRLGVFVGGFTLEGAEAVCNAQRSPDVLEGVAALADNSLLRQKEGSDAQPRFRMLETIRAYALERLEESGDLEALRRAHGYYYAHTIIDEMGTRIYSPETTRWLDWIEGELDNVRAALAWSQSTPEGFDLGPLLVFYLTWFWYRRGYFGEGRGWAERVLASPAAQGDTLGRAMALQSSALLAMWQTDLHIAAARAEESLALWRQIGDEPGLPITLMNGGTVLINMGDDTSAYPVLKEAQALFAVTGDTYFYAITLVHLGNVALGLGNPAEARTWLDEAYGVSREFGEPWIISFALNNLGEVARVEGDYDQARRYYEESQGLLESMGDKGDLARLVHSLGYVALHQGDAARAEAQFTHSLAMFRTLGNRRGIAECLAGLAVLWAGRGASRRAARMLGAAQGLLDAAGAAWWPADRVEIERSLAALRSELDEETFAAAWDAGQAMTLEQAIADAVQAS